MAPFTIGDSSSKVEIETHTPVAGDIARSMQCGLEIKDKNEMSYVMNKREMTREHINLHHLLQNNDGLIVEFCGTHYQSIALDYIP